MNAVYGHDIYPRCRPLVIAEITDTAEINGCSVVWTEHYRSFISPRLRPNRRHRLRGFWLHHSAASFNRLLRLGIIEKKIDLDIW